MQRIANSSQELLGTPCSGHRPARRVRIELIQQQTNRYGTRLLQDSRAWPISWEPSLSSGGSTPRTALRASSPLPGAEWQWMGDVCHAMEPECAAPSIAHLRQHLCTPSLQGDITPAGLTLTLAPPHARCRCIPRLTHRCQPEEAAPASALSSTACSPRRMCGTALAIAFSSGLAAAAPGCTPRAPYALVKMEVR